MSQSVGEERVKVVYFSHVGEKAGGGGARRGNILISMLITGKYTDDICFKKKKKESTYPHKTFIRILLS